MKKSNIFIVFIISTLFLYSCMPEPLEIDIPQSEPKIVISSQFLQDSGVVVFCSRTFSALSDDYLPNQINYDFINNTFGLHSLVLMEHNGKTDTLYNMGMGMYFNDSIKFNVGQNCHLYAYDSIINQSIVADAVYLQNVNFDTAYVEIEIVGVDTNAIIHFRIKDIAGDNYYLVNHYVYETNQNAIDYSEFLGENPYAEMFETMLQNSQLGSMVTQYASIGNVENEIKLINDKNFQNQILTDSVKFEKISLNDTVAVSVANISKEYNDYLELRLKANTIYSQLMSDPINMPSNVIGGYGMFTTHSLNVWIIDLSKYKTEKRRKRN